MRQRYRPGVPDPARSGGQIGNTGDAINLAAVIGAATLNMEHAWCAPVFSIPGEYRGRLSTTERALPGCIIVNQAGRRFMNEAAAYDIVGARMIAADRPGASTCPSFMIFDARYRRRYPVGPLLPGVPLWLHQRGVRDVLSQAPTLAELAARIGVPAEALTSTVREFNAGAAIGKDPEYGRGDTAYDRFYGDPKVTPNPTLAPLAEAPYFAIPVHAGDIGTNGGLLTNEQAQVLDTARRPIPGLYATGNCTASVMGHAYPGAGGTLGPSMTFGFIAARHALGL
jgi:3-oxosteroid 1-dehydrogenase